MSGVTPAYAVVRNRPVVIGNFIAEADVNGRTRVAVIGSRIAERFFEEAGVYPIGATLQINDIPFKVIGQLAQHPLTDIGIDKFLKDWQKVES